MFIIARVTVTNIENNKHYYVELMARLGGFSTNVSGNRKEEDSWTCRLFKSYLAASTYLEKYLKTSGTYATKTDSGMGFFIPKYSKLYRVFYVVMSTEEFSAWHSNGLTYRLERDGYLVPNVYSAGGSLISQD